jgi:flagellar protein FlaJ
VKKAASLGSTGQASITFFDRFTALSYKVFGKQGKKLSMSMPSLRDELIKSNLRITPEGLMSVILFATLASVAAGAVCVVLALELGIVYIAFGAVAPPVVFIFLFNAPKISQGSRSGAMDNEFPFVIGFMEVLAGGGVSAISAMRRISDLKSIFPAASKEAKRILVDIDVFGIDPISAMEKAARYSPNKLFKEFLYGYTTVLKTGGEASTYITSKMKETFENRGGKIRRTSDSIGSMAEAYLTVTSVLGISLFTLYQVQAVISHSTSGMQSLLVFAYIVIPLVTLVFIYILDGIQPKQPFFDKRPYKIFAYTGVLGVIVYLLPLPVRLPVHVSIALAASVAVPAIYTSRYTREVRGVERALPEFIRDVAEGRKMGLAPEGSIEQLASKHYGALSKSIKMMGSQISWGLPLATVVSSFVSNVYSWVTRVVGTLMVEVVDVGGGTVKSFSELADFTRKVNDIETEKRSMLRPYVFVAYVSGIMLVMTTFLMVYFLSQPLAASGAAKLGLTSIDSGTIDQLLVASIFDSWIVGFMAGKMGEGSVAEGFKHAMILAIVGALTIFIASIFEPLPI